MEARSAKRNGTPSSSRGEERVDSIRQVALDLVAAHGVDGVTIDAIATAAKASKATMYRRWATKSELISDAIKMTFTGVTPGDPGDLGDLRAELRLVLEGAAAMLRENGKLIIALLDGAQRDPEVWAIMQRETRGNLTDTLQQPLLRAIARGEIGPSTNLNLISDVAMPMLLQRAIWHEPLDDRSVDSLLDSVVLRLLDPPVAQSS